ncbi:MAG: DUF1566 domain-containing protein [Candidatus Peribacteria bacterium]|nr:DUF1566 domain-containing protein [Candidatus Peribacteria bacterium]
MVDYTTYNPSINTAYFTDTNTSNRYWSSTTTANGTSYAWIVNFNYGYSGRDGKTYSNYVRCVR